MVSIVKRNCITHLRQKKNNIKNHDDHFDILKKVIFPDILFIGSYDTIWTCKVNVPRHTDVYFETECLHFGSKKKKLLASSWAMFELSHKIMYVRRIVHKQFKIAYPPLLAICNKEYIHNITGFSLYIYCKSGLWKETNNVPHSAHTCLE